MLHTFSMKRWGNSADLNEAVRPPYLREKTVLMHVSPWKESIEWDIPPLLQTTG